MKKNEYTQDSIRDLIIKFLRGETSPGEVIIIEEWLNEDPSHREEFHRINTTVQAIGNGMQNKGKSVDDAWRSLSSSIESGSKEARSVPFRKPGLPLYKIAASVVIAVAAGLAAWTYFTNNDFSFLPQSAFLLREGKSYFMLPDGSEVWVNAGSSVQYDKDFGTNVRKIILKGEAFFDVRKSKVPFIVSTENINVEVKGTRFNVESFRNGDVKTTLEEGRVVLKIRKTNETYAMVPGDQITFNKRSSKVAVEKVNTSDYTAWKEDHLVFQNAPLSDIARKLENRYKVKIRMDSTIGEREKITMTLKDESLEEALDLIALSSSLKYRISGDAVVIFE